MPSSPVGLYWACAELVTAKRATLATAAMTVLFVVFIISYLSIGRYRLNFDGLLCGPCFSITTPRRRLPLWHPLPEADRFLLYFFSIPSVCPLPGFVAQQKTESLPHFSQTCLTSFFAPCPAPTTVIVV